MTALFIAWTGCLLSLPVLIVCAVLERPSRKFGAGLRRRIWRSGVIAALALCPLSLLLRPAEAGGDFWHKTAPVTASPLTTTIQAVADLAEPAISAPARLEADERWSAPLGAASAVYLVGFALLLARLLAGQVRVSRHLRNTRAIEDPDLIRRCRELAVRLGCRAPLRLRWHAGPPAVFGIVRRGILLPVGSRDWSARQRDAVLGHELAHLRHHDYLLRLLTAAFCAFQWFNPLAWLASRRLKELSELSADEVAASVSGDPLGYAATLVTIARGFRSRPALVGMADHALARRVDYLLDGGCPGADKATTRVALATVAVCALAVGTVATAFEWNGRHLVGWEPQQIRWESADTANGIFLHGEVSLRPGALAVGDEGLLVAVSESGDELRACVAWRAVDRFRFECDGAGNPQRQLDRLFSEAAPLWPRDPRSALANYWQQNDRADRFSGSHITGIPGRSRNPDRHILQAGWLGPDGERIGVFRRRDAFRLAFRYRPVTRSFRLVKQQAGSGTLTWSSSGWRRAGARERAWFEAVTASTNPG